ncbi:DUF2332 domain-containing protein [Geodermatophilus sp. SYSU D00766]
MDPDPRTAVAQQARSVAAAWSPPDAPPSWWLTAATFTAVAEDAELLDLAAAVPLDRLPPLLLSAAIRFHLARRGGDPLAAFYPRAGGAQPPADPGFRPALRAFARAEAPALARLCREHRYQMTEVSRCLDVLAALVAVTEGDRRPIALIDLGTGAGLGLRLDRYRYTYLLPDGTRRTAGDERSPVTLSCSVRGQAPLPARPRLPLITHRLGIDVEPLDPADAGTAAWLAACVPPEVGAVTRFAAAVEVARAHPAATLRGDLVDVLPAVVEEVPADALLCLVDTYAHVFLTPERQAVFRDVVARIGRARDVEWISVDPLVPLGPAATGTVQALDVPPDWLRENRDGGLFGVIGRLGHRDGTSHGAVLGRSHPSAAWLEWTPPPP